MPVRDALIELMHTAFLKQRAKQVVEARVFTGLQALYTVVGPTLRVKFTALEDEPARPPPQLVFDS